MKDKWLEYYETYVNPVTNKENVDRLTSCMMAATNGLHEILKVDISHNLATVMFALTYETIIEELVELQKKWKSWTINFCDILKIGYTDGDGNEDDEKQGNFAPFLIDGGGKAKKTDNIPEGSTVERAVAWLSINSAEETITNQNQIESKAIKKLAEYDIHLSAKELVIPIFIITYQRITEKLMLERKDSNAFELELDILGLFKITVRENSDDMGRDFIALDASPCSKLMLKNDDAVTATKE